VAPLLQIVVPLAAEAPTTLLGPKKPRRLLGIAQNQAGASVVVETVKAAGDT
jgi:hypothetical protein